MKKGREQNELSVFHLESATAFTNTAFPEDENLLACPQRLNHDGPFFEANPHSGSLSQRRQPGNAQTNFDLKGSI